MLIVQYHRNDFLKVSSKFSWFIIELKHLFILLLQAQVNGNSRLIKQNFDLIYIYLYTWLCFEGNVSQGKIVVSCTEVVRDCFFFLKKTK